MPVTLKLVELDKIPRPMQVGWLNSILQHDSWRKNLLCFSSWCQSTHQDQVAYPIFNLGSKSEDLDGKAKNSRTQEETWTCWHRCGCFGGLEERINWWRGFLHTSSTQELHVESSFLGRGHVQFFCRYDGNSCIAGILCNINKLGI